MKVNLSQKERLLLQDQKSHEELCIEKYTKYANQAQDTVLKQLFTSYAAEEQQHLNTINQILAGQVPNINQQQGQQQGQQQQSTMQSQGTTGTFNESDATLCKDLLMAEKYVSSTYNTAIFEFRDANIRNVLNYIQKEEQQHGEGIFNYMYSRGMYTVQ